MNTLSITFFFLGLCSFVGTFLYIKFQKLQEEAGNKIVVKKSVHFWKYQPFTDQDIKLLAANPSALDWIKKFVEYKVGLRRDLLSSLPREQVERTIGEIKWLTDFLLDINSFKEWRPAEEEEN